MVNFQRFVVALPGRDVSGFHLHTLPRQQKPPKVPELPQLRQENRNANKESKDLLETVYTLLEKHNSINHFAYERNGTCKFSSLCPPFSRAWKMGPRVVREIPPKRLPSSPVGSYLSLASDINETASLTHTPGHIGLGSYASLFISANGKEAKTSSQGKPSQTVSVNETITDIARHFVSQYKYLGGKIFGQAGFNYGCHVRNQDYPPGRWPIFSLMVPITEITLSASQITIQGHDEKVVTDACDWIKNASAVHVRDAQPLSTLQNEEEHKSNVRIVLKEIAAGEYTKIIMSRAVDLEGRVDMLAILYHGRRGNTPARAFTMNHGGFEATGFSPELVVAVENGKVVTEPLAGTTSRIGTEQEVETPGNRLINNDKEIVEHVISVKEAITELNRLCPRKTVAIEDLVSTCIPFLPFPTAPSLTKNLIRW